MNIADSAAVAVPINSERLEGDQLYESDAKGAACLLLQREIISTQAVLVEKYLRDGILLQEKHLQISVDSSQLGEVLRNRMKDVEETKTASSSSSSGSKKKERIMDDIEVTIMGILDSDGKITVKTRLEEFMSLMTRIDKGDHRALCLHILQKNISSACEHAFIQEGGLRLLKQWIKTSQEQKSINELKSICKLLKKLPYYCDQLQACGFASTLKSLKKWENGIIEKHVQAITGAWNNQEASSSSSPSSSSRSNPAASVPLTNEQKNMTSAMREKMVKERGDGEEHVDKSVSTTPKTVVSQSIGMKVVAVAAAGAAASDPKVSPTVRSGVGLSVVKPAAVKAASVSLEPPEAPMATTATQAVAPTSIPMATTAAAVPRAASKKVDIGAIARAAADDADRKAKEEASEARANAPKPGKGGLKRSYGDISGGANGSAQEQKVRKVKRSIRWADAEGLPLKDVQTFFVEGLKASTSKHKDAAAREKLLEKESRKAHKKDSMIKKCEWAIPEKLGWFGDVLPIQEQVLESFESKETDVIRTRLEVTPEESYPDVTLIPQDPSEPNEACDAHSVPGKPTVNYELVFHSGPVGGSNPWGTSGAVDEFQPLSATDGRLSQAILAHVPEQLHFVGGPVLEKLAQEPAQIASLLNFDGSPNMSMINAFRSHVLGPSVPPLGPPHAPTTAPVARQSRFSNANTSQPPAPYVAQRYR